MTCCLRHWTHLFDFPLCRFLGIKHLESRFRIPFWKEYFIACHDTEVLPPGKIGHAILYEEIIGIGLSLRESQSGPCAYLLVRWGYFSHRPWWNTLRNTGTRAVILSSLALFAPEHRTSPRGIFDTPIDLDGDAAKRGRLQVWILLACCRNAHAFLPGMASMQGRSAVPPAAGSAPRRQSAVLLNRCAWDSPLSFAFTIRLRFLTL